ncbi:GAF sensor protein [Alteromonas mediterranea]|nr:GAF sensor protein [Alteromonas mediterranea]AFV84887.1 putative GAF sensor protein [Alteromonas mediterranea DE1]AGP96897.1 GAF sensor protein [Alteromonas mediterranea UM7]AGQ01248.1 GAF sensor protein [Alteromonas mediterranea UM4b]
MRNKDGYELGTLCLLYDEPKAFSSDDIDTLKQYARITENIIFSEHLQ